VKGDNAGCFGGKNLSQRTGAEAGSLSRAGGVRLVAALLLAAMALASAGCAGRNLSPPPPRPDPMDRENYRIGVTDILRISVWKNEDLSIDVPVRPDGKISVALLNDVHAAGLTPTELKEVLTREFAEFVTAPNVTVVVISVRSRSVSVIGGVNRPGHFPIERHLRVLEAIAAAGGFSSFAQKNDVRVVRRTDDGGEVEFRFDYGAYIKGNAPGTNIELVSGDTIIVPD
jgi:polysaccharide export outer membrane protein